MKQVIAAVKNAFLIARACRLNNLHRYDEALQYLDRVALIAEDLAKVTLLQADFLHRRGDYREACKKYEDFLSRKLEVISRPNDRQYLDIYARYYLYHASRKFGLARCFEVALDEMQVAGKSASMLTRSEFPPQ